MYADLTVIVDGAIETEETHYDYALLRDAIVMYQHDAEGHGYPTDIFVQYHDHDPGPCECAQFETDHRPFWSSNA